MKYFYKTIVFWYMLIAILIVGLAYTSFYEWRKLEALEEENRQINVFRLQLHDAYVQMIEFSLLGETILEWKTDDLENYHSQRMAMDSMLCCFKDFFPSASIDSLRQLLEDKEIQIRSIVQALDQQTAINKKIASQIPVIVQKSKQESSAKPKRKGFLGIFGKKEETKQTITTTMLYKLNQDVIAKQREQSKRLSEHTDSLTEDNVELKHQLQELIHEMDNKVQQDFQEREDKIISMRENSFLLVGGTTVFALLLLLVSYIIIHYNRSRIHLYKKETEDLIKRLEESVDENKILISSRKKAMHTITHELRMPLSAIHGYAELIGTDEDDSLRVRHAETIRYASMRMAEMIDMLLNYFRLDSGKETVRLLPFRLKNISDTLETEFMIQMEKKGLVFETVNEADEVVMGDRNLILRIGSNLLSNALKFTQKGYVKLICKYADGFFILEVDDTGTGISKEKLEQIFKPFERLSNAATQDGFGLGLSIVRSLAELMGGSIIVESIPEKGSRFTVMLPLDKADKTEEQSSSYIARQNLSGCSILSIDNDRIILDMVHDMLEQSGAHCETCMDMNQLTEKLRDNCYDLLTTDLKMPNFSGYDVLELLRSSDIGNSRTIPVLAITGSGSVTEEELKQASFSGVLFKPFSIGELLAAIEQCIGENRTRYIDLTPLFAYGDKRYRLECLINETEKEMAGIREAMNNADKDKIDDWIHHIRSSWMLIRAEQPLQELYDAIHENRIMEEIQVRVGNVLAQGERIIRLAKKEIEKTIWEE